MRMRKNKAIFVILIIALISIIFAFLGAFTVLADETEGDYTYIVFNDEAIIMSYNGSEDNVAIPSTLGGYPVTTIGLKAFEGSSVKNVSMPSVVTIDDEAFYNCDLLVGVDMPNVATIGVLSFSGCDSLQSLYMPKAVAVGVLSFYECSALVSVDMPKVTDIWTAAFKYCAALENVNMPSVVTINTDAFADCSALTKIVIPDSATKMGDNAFGGCESLTIYASQDSYAYKYASENNLKVKDPNINDAVEVDTPNGYLWVIVGVVSVAIIAIAVLIFVAKKKKDN